MAKSMVSPFVAQTRWTWRNKAVLPVALLQEDWFSFSVSDYLGFAQWGSHFQFNLQEGRDFLSKHFFKNSNNCCCRQRILTCEKERYKVFTLLGNRVQRLESQIAFDNMAKGSQNFIEIILESFGFHICILSKLTNLA